MRILFVTGYGHLFDTVGGLQTTLDALCRGLAARGVEAALLCATAPPEAAAREAADVALGYPVLRRADPLRALHEAVRALRPDLLLLLSGPCLVPMIVAALDEKLPVAVYLHNVEFDQLGGVLLPDPALCYLVNSPFTAGRLGAMFGIAATVIEPLICREEYVTETSRERLLFVNPTLLKGVDLVLRLAERLPQLPLSIVESWTIEPPWRDYCRARLERLDHVAWHGPSADMRRHFAQARVLLMPSVWEESYGRTATEAQLCGIPVLASDRGNLRDTVGEGGVILDLHAPLARWEEALLDLWAPGEHYDRASAAARRHAHRPELDEDRLLDRLMACLAQHVARAEPVA